MISSQSLIAGSFQWMILPKSINDYGATDIPIATKWKPIAVLFYENWQLWKCMHNYWWWFVAEKPATFLTPTISKFSCMKLSHGMPYFWWYESGKSLLCCPRRLIWFSGHQPRKMSKIDFSQILTESYENMTESNSILGDIFPCTVRFNLLNLYI